MQIEIDQESGFCFGVTTAIRKAEESLRCADNVPAGPLYCLGDIVHNRRECERLHELGLRTIDHQMFRQLPAGSRVLLRAHGEPPATYEAAREREVSLIDATCPVVLQLQRRIRRAYEEEPSDTQIVIYGKPGHAEVLGLVGQTEGHAIVIAHPDEAVRLDMHRSIRLFSQTTQPLEGFRQLVDYLQAHVVAPATFQFTDTICRQVANRLPGVRAFAACHDVVLFVCGLKSSNGRVLYEACRQVNGRSYLVDDPAAIRAEWFSHAQSVGICGATSTPKWLMEACSEAIRRMYPDE